MNAASSTPAPVQMPDVSSKPVQRALQNAQEFVSDVAHQYQCMKDFGEQTRLEGRMNDLASEFEQEMTRRLGFARGHELSFYDRTELRREVPRVEGEFCFPGGGRQVRSQTAGCDAPTPGEGFRVDA